MEMIEMENEMFYGSGGQRASSYISVGNERFRGELFGWCTTYGLCKAMGEMMLNEIKGIIRPSSIVESCYQEPLPGWIQGMRMCDPVIASYGKGLLPAFAANPRAPLNLVSRVDYLIYIV